MVFCFLHTEDDLALLVNTAIKEDAMRFFEQNVKDKEKWQLEEVEDEE